MPTSKNDSSSAAASELSPSVRLLRQPKKTAESARLALALSAGKLAGSTGRLLRVGGGTSFPGVVARRIDPQVLRKIMGASRARKVVVCGSNGKTTTCRMLAALSQTNGKRVTQNRTGSNLLGGVTSAAVNGASLRGNL